MVCCVKKGQPVAYEVLHVSAINDRHKVCLFPVACVAAVYKIERGQSQAGYSVGRVAHR